MLIRANLMHRHKTRRQYAYSENNRKIFVHTISATPTVAENEATLNAPVLYCTRKEVFPTPESPSRIVYGSTKEDVAFNLCCALCFTVD